MLNGNRTKSGRERHPRDFYITPPELALEAMIRFLADERLTQRERIIALDAGCGTGVWGDAAKRFACYEPKRGTGYLPLVDGIDIHPDVSLDVQENAYFTIMTGDFLEYTGVSAYNLIFGNPPYSLAEKFIRHSFELLNPGGYVYFLLRLSFLEGISRGKNLFVEFPMKRIYVCSRRPSFYSTKEKRHTTDTLAYAMFLWQKGYPGKTEISYMDWEYKK